MRHAKRSNEILLNSSDKRVILEVERSISLDTQDAETAA